MIRIKTFVITLVVIFVTFSLLFFLTNPGVVSTSNAVVSSWKGKWIVKVIDKESGNEIENAVLGVTDLEKEYHITKNSNIIELPVKPSSLDTISYPYGYTIITHAKGYLPHIDHNMMMGKDSEIYIDIALTKPGLSDNSLYTEEFHKTSPTALGEFIENNLGNNIYPVK